MQIVNANDVQLERPSMTIYTKKREKGLKMHCLSSIVVLVLWSISLCNPMANIKTIPFSFEAMRRLSQASFAFGRKTQ